MKEFSKIPTEIKTYENQTVELLEWSGSRRHPKAIQRVMPNCRVEIKGQTAIIFDGIYSFTKRVGTRGFKFYGQGD